MDLNEFISEAIKDIMKGIYDADKSLRENDRGEVWTKDIYTKATDMVTLGLLKGKVGEDDNSVPVFAIQFNVNVALEQEKSEGTNTGVRSGLKIMSLIDFGGNIEANSGSKATEKSIHNLKFSVPIEYKYPKSGQEARTLHIQPE